MAGKSLTLDEFRALAGTEVGVSDWIEVPQEKINAFAEVTGDHQFIHVNEEMAKMTPFGGTIAHGFLTLSLIPHFFASAIDVLDTRMGVNYGLNRVRFLSPVRVGSRLRARLKLLTSEPIEGNGFQMVWEVTVEQEGASKPACVAESIVRRYA